MSRYITVYLTQNISSKLLWEDKLGNYGNIPNWKLAMGVMGINQEFIYTIYII